MSSSRTFDAIVVGSGISGGWAAKELTESGLDVLLVERGRPVEHIHGYPNAFLDPWDLAYAGMPAQDLLTCHPIQSQHPDFSSANASFWVDDREHPYSQIRPFHWFRGYQVGGRSLTWGRQSLRWGPGDFEANAQDGIGVDWPIRYHDLAPWYDHVETFIGVSGSLESLPQLPDGQFLPPMPMNCVEQAVSARLNDVYGGTRRMIIGRTANLTTNLPGRSRCRYLNACSRGCVFGAYFSTQSSTLPAAVATKRLTLRPNAYATEVLFDRVKRRATGLRIIDTIRNETVDYHARLVFLCASALNTAWILMNSATGEWPDGLGSSSGELGRNVMDHHSRCGAYGKVEGFEHFYTYGRRPAGIYIPRFRNLGDDCQDYGRGFAYQGSAFRLDWRQDPGDMGLGAPLKQRLSTPGDWFIALRGYGETLPVHENRVYLDRTKPDKWGLPTLAAQCEIGANEHRMRVDIKDAAAEILEAAGASEIETYDTGYVFGASVHEMGAARMGRDPKTSVLNQWNQVWDAPNVFVTDGACMTSSACQNPSLTYMALTARAAHYAVDQLRKQNL